MDNTEPGDHVAEFTLALLRGGLMLSGISADLAEGLPEDAYPGEEPGAIVIEMMTGTIRTAIGGVNERELERATDLIAEACHRVHEHVELALKLAERMRDTPDGGGRAYG